MNTFSDGSPVDFSAAKAAAGDKLTTCPIRWRGTDGSGAKKLYGYSLNGKNANEEAVKAGAVNCHTEDNPDYVNPDLPPDTSDAEIASLKSQLSAAQAEAQAATEKLNSSNSDKMALAQTNTTMFNQVNAMKGALRDIESGVVAWNTEAQAKAQAAGTAYEEPFFVGVVRDRAKLAQ